MLLIGLTVTVLFPTRCALAEDFPGAAELRVSYERTPPAPPLAGAESPRLLDGIERGAFNYFWNEVGSPAPLVRDSTADRVCSTAGVGFQLASLPIGVERGWVSRGDAERRAARILRSLLYANGNRKWGVYLHFVDLDSGAAPDFSKTRRRYEVLASTVDHALLLAGVMVASEYFQGEIAELGGELIDQTDWRAYQGGPSGMLSLGWEPNNPNEPEGAGRLSPWYWSVASCEERLIYFLATGAPNEGCRVEPSKYYQLQRQEQRHGTMPPFVCSWNGSLFTYFLSHCWIDYRGLGSDRPEEFGSDQRPTDWWENSKRAVLTHRQRCIEQSPNLPTLGENRWGLSACLHGSSYFVHEVRPNLSRQDVWYGGVLPPFAAAACLPITPHESLQALREYRKLEDAEGRPLVWRDPSEGGYGFVDSFSLDPPRAPTDYVAIDQGAMLLAVENARTGLIWRLFMRHPVAAAAAERLRFAPQG